MAEEAAPETAKKRPRLELDGGRERKRGKSMFGLVIGTLNKAKIEDRERSASEAAKKRHLIEQRLQTKLRKETDSVRRAEEAKKDKMTANRKEEELQLKDSIVLQIPPQPPPALRQLSPHIRHHPRRRAPLPRFGGGGGGEGGGVRSAGTGNEASIDEKVDADAEMGGPPSASVPEPEPAPIPTSNPAPTAMDVDDELKTPASASVPEPASVPEAEPRSEHRPAQEEKKEEPLGGDEDEAVEY
ncbi:hypothetical protein J132_04054 [Termitomyces sp. J132]|nr:hypothetical protein J132_04054 [Termitomyces sp. J132]